MPHPLTKAGANLPVTVNDRFHLGSDTNAMTALLAAMLVEEGKIRRNSILSQRFSRNSGQRDKDMNTRAAKTKTARENFLEDRVENGGLC